MTPLVAVAVGACAGLGILLVVAGVAGRAILPNCRRWLPSSERMGTAAAWAGGAGIAAFVVFALTGWPVAALLVGVAVWWAPSALRSTSDREDTIARTEAVAVWAEMIRDNMAGSAGLEQALVAASQVAPDAIARELRRFAGRIDRMPLVDALNRLGEELDHPSADMVVVALANAARMEARELAPLLSRLAETIRADVRMRLRVEVGRTRIRTSAQIVVATTVVTIAFLFVFSRQLLEAYDSVAGQIWLAVVAGVFATGGWMLHTFGQLEMPERFSSRAVRTGDAR